MVKEALKRLKGKCTLVVVAHRWSMVNWADQVLVIRDGRLVQKGLARDPERRGRGRLAAGAWPQSSQQNQQKTA